MCMQASKAAFSVEKIGGTGRFDEGNYTLKIEGCWFQRLYDFHTENWGK